MRTEIYGTFGPACSRQETLEGLYERIVRAESKKN